MRLITDNTLHGNSRAAKKVTFFKIGKAVEDSYGDLICHMFSLEDAAAHLTINNPSRILTNKYTRNFN